MTGTYMIDTSGSTSSGRFYNVDPEQAGGGLIAIRVDELESVVITTDKYESIRETAAILEDKKLAAAVRKGMRQAEQGKTVPWDEAKKRLGL
jgi:hypothetical protein